MPHPLDNPVHASLTGPHASLALRSGDAARYPADVAPFFSLAGSGTDASDAFEALVAPGETVFALGARPQVDARAEVRHLADLLQMVCTTRIAEVDGPPIVPLGEDRRDAVLELTALVYPHYFRPRTMALGRYFGIFEDGRLAAMIGERMAAAQWQEISAVCTHPEHTGRGLARRLLARLGNDVLAQGRTPFLHVSPDNERAIALYADNGYEVRRRIAFWSVRRPAAPQGVEPR